MRKSIVNRLNVEKADEVVPAPFTGSEEFMEPTIEWILFVADDIAVLLGLLTPEAIIIASQT